MNEKQKHEWDIWVRKYLKEWFSGLFEGLSQIDSDIRKKILFSTGKKCANCGANKTYQKLWDKSESISEFIERLDKAFGDPRFVLIDETTVEVIYPRCFCPLVKLELIDTGKLCDCSVAWLQHNFETVLSKKVRVKRYETVLQGSSQCRFLVEFKKVA